MYLASRNTGDNDRVVVKKPNSTATTLELGKQAVEDAAKEVRGWKRISKSCFILPLLDIFVILEITNTATGQPIPMLITVAPYREDTLKSHFERVMILESHEIFLFAYQLMLGGELS